MEFYDGAAWYNINTPPIGSTYIQWVNAANPNTIYPNTTWVRTDLQAGEFLRATGGNANVSNAGTPTGTVQTSSFENHTHTISGTVSDPGGTTTSVESNPHTHNWGGWWSTDDSRDYSSGTGNGDGSSNTTSDGDFNWGGIGGTTTTYTTRTGTAAGSHSHTGTTGNALAVSGGLYIPYDDNLSNCAEDLGSASGTPTQCGSGWNGYHTFGNFMGQIGDNCIGHTHNVTTNTVTDHTHNYNLYAHRHFIKQRATGNESAQHTHTVPAHSLNSTLSIGNSSSSSAGTETRPVNQAAVFWRRTL
jgi:hypothetical protein